MRNSAAAQQMPMPSILLVDRPSSSISTSARDFVLCMIRASSLHSEKKVEASSRSGTSFAHMPTRVAKSERHTSEKACGCPLTRQDLFTEANLSVRSRHVATDVREDVDYPDCTQVGRLAALNR